MGQSGATPATLPVSGPCLHSDTRCTTRLCGSRSRGGLGQSPPASPALGAAWRAREISLRSVSNLKSTRVLQQLLTQLVSGYYALRPVATVHRNDFSTILGLPQHSEMPRTYRCKKCQRVHPPPTGKHCQHVEIESEDGGDDTLGQILHAITNLGAQMMDMNTQRQNVAAPSEREDSDEEDNEIEQEQGETLPAPTASPDREIATPDSLRQNIQLMAQAAGRIAQLRDDEDDEEDSHILPGARARGKKSGALLVAADTIKRTIDWPHFHVQRVTNGTRKNLTYSELKVEEFVFGFLTMLASPRCKMDKDIMIELLRKIMQDTMDYSWSNAMGFYKIIGQEVELGTLKWDDSDAIREYRMQYSRALFPEKKQESKDNSKPTPRQAPQGMKCCAAYQKHTCEQQRDHQPYTHACAYCFRSCSALCRHPENDCYRKLSDEAKNGQKREAQPSL